MAALPATQEHSETEEESVFPADEARACYTSCAHSHGPSTPHVSCARSQEPPQLPLREAAAKLPAPEQVTKLSLSVIGCASEPANHVIPHLSTLGPYMYAHTEV